MPPESPASQGSPFVRLLGGQFLAFLVALLLFGLHSGGHLRELGSPIDVPYLAIAAAWAMSLALVLWRVPARPDLALYFCLAPAVLGLGVACLYIGRVPRVTGAGTDCDLFLAVAFFAQRHLFLGLLATGSLWLGTLSVLMPRERATVREAGWVFVVAGATFIAVAAWTFVDAAMPEKTQVGGYAVRGLWVLLGGGAVLWLWARLFPRVTTNSSALPAILAATGGLFMLGWALVSYHRTCGLHHLAFDTPGLTGDDRAEAGVVAATALQHLLPFLSILVLAAVFLRVGRFGFAYAKKTIGLLLVLLAILGMGTGFELGWRGQYRERCVLVLPADLELPVSQSTGGPGPGPLLMVSEKSAWLEEKLVLEGEVPVLGRRTDTPREEALNLAADSRLRFERLYTFLRAAGVAGWRRFHLVVRPPVEKRCTGELRLYGVCLSKHFSFFRAIPFEIAHFEGNLKPSGGVTANLIVEKDRMEISFGGFGVSAEDLDSLAATLPDRLKTRDLAGLSEALSKAHARFEDSRTLILLPHDGMTTQKLVFLLDRIRKQGPVSAFPHIIISRLLR
jgi:hypothetical protein